MRWHTCGIIRAKKFEVCPVWICVAADADTVLVGALVPLDSYGPDGKKCGVVLGGACGLHQHLPVHLRYLVLDPVKKSVVFVQQVLILHHELRQHLCFSKV